MVFKFSGLLPIPVAFFADKFTVAKTMKKFHFVKLELSCAETKTTIH